MRPAKKLSGTKAGLWFVGVRDYSKTARPYYFCTCAGCGAKQSVSGHTLAKKGLLGGCSQCRKPSKLREYRAEYAAWGSIKTRVFNPNRKEFAHYSKLGMYQPWVTSFESFLAEIGPRPGPGYTVDRVNTKRGYWPGNVRWATRKEQSHNSRRNITATYRGKTKVLMEWARTLDVSYPALIYRVKIMKLPFKDAIRQPIGKFIDHWN